MQRRDRFDVAESSLSASGERGRSVSRAMFIEHLYYPTSIRQDTELPSNQCRRLSLRAVRAPGGRANRVTRPGCLMRRIPRLLRLPR